MIKEEHLTSQEVLKGLTDEQRTAILELSANDEKATLEEYGKGLSSSFEDRLKAEKAAEQAKLYRELGKIAGKEVKTAKEFAEAVKASSLEEGKRDVSEWERKAKDAESLVEASRLQIDEMKAGFEGEKAKMMEEFKSGMIKAEMKRAASSLTFKRELSPDTVKMLAEASVDRILSEYSPEMLDDSTFAFRGKDGSVLRSKENRLQPVTVEELLKERLKDVLETEKKPYRFNTGGMRTDFPVEGLPTNRMELTPIVHRMAQEIVEKKGFVKGKYGYEREIAKERDRIWKENKYDELPLTPRK